MFGEIPEAIYIFAATLDQAERIMKSRGYSPDQWVYVHKNLSQYIRRRIKRTIYFCGSFYDRRDYSEAEYLCRQNGWNVIKGEYPPHVR